MEHDERTKRILEMIRSEWKELSAEEKIKKAKKIGKKAYRLKPGWALQLIRNNAKRCGKGREVLLFAAERLRKEKSADDKAVGLAILEAALSEKKEGGNGEELPYPLCCQGIKIAKTVYADGSIGCFIIMIDDTASKDDCRAAAAFAMAALGETDAVFAWLIKEDPGEVARIKEQIEELSDIVDEAFLAEKNMDPNDRIRGK